MVKAYSQTSNLASGGLWKNKCCTFPPCEWAALTQLPSRGQQGLCIRQQPGHCPVLRYVAGEKRKQQKTTSYNSANSNSRQYILGLSIT